MRSPMPRRSLGSRRTRRANRRRSGRWLESAMSRARLARRHAEHESVRRARSTRCRIRRDPGTALNSEFKIDCCAVERISDRTSSSNRGASQEQERGEARACHRPRDGRARCVGRRGSARQPRLPGRASEAAAAAPRSAEPDPVESAPRARKRRQARAHEEAERLRVEQEAAARRREAQESAARARLERLRMRRARRGTAHRRLTSWPTSDAAPRSMISPQHVASSPSSGRNGPACVWPARDRSWHRYAEAEPPSWHATPQPRSGPARPAAKR